MTTPAEEATDPELSLRVARNIRAELHRKGWSQAELAAKAGYSEAALSRRFKGGDALTVRDLERIATALELAPTQFFHA